MFPEDNPNQISHSEADKPNRELLKIAQAAWTLRIPAEKYEGNEQHERPLIKRFGNIITAIGTDHIPPEEDLKIIKKTILEEEKKATESGAEIVVILENIEKEYYKSETFPREALVIANFADDNKIKWRNGSLSYEEQKEQYGDPEEHWYFTFLQQIWQHYSQNGEDASVTKYFNEQTNFKEEYLPKFQKFLRDNGYESDILVIEEVGKNIEPIPWKDYQVNRIKEIATRLNILTDRRLLEVIMKTLDEGKKPVIVFGAGHIVMNEEVWSKYAEKIEELRRLEQNSEV